MKYFFPFCFLAFYAVTGHASEPTDLGHNLSYVRVHSLDDVAPALIATLSAGHSFVLDLRYATGTTESIATLRTAIEGHPADVPLFILISPSTPANALEVLSSVNGLVITLGIGGPNSSPKVVIKTDAVSDRRAYDALDAGTPVADLVSGKIEKDRYDEATLVGEFKNGYVNPEPPLSPDPAKAKSSTSTDKAIESALPVPDPLKDRVLQRALNLYQALQALRVRR